MMWLHTASATESLTKVLADRTESFVSPKHISRQAVCVRVLRSDQMRTYFLN